MLEIKVLEVLGKKERAAIKHESMKDLSRVIRLVTLDKESDFDILHLAVVDYFSYLVGNIRKILLHLSS